MSTMAVDTYSCLLRRGWGCIGGSTWECCSRDCSRGYTICLNAQMCMFTEYDHPSCVPYAAASRFSRLCLHLGPNIISTYISGIIHVQIAASSTYVQM